MRRTAVSCPEHPACVAQLVTAPADSEQKSIKAPEWAKAWLVARLEREILLEISHEPAGSVDAEILVASHAGYQNAYGDQINDLSARVDRLAARFATLSSEVERLRATLDDNEVFAEGLLRGVIRDLDAIRWRKRGFQVWRPRRPEE